MPSTSDGHIYEHNIHLIFAFNNVKFLKPAKGAAYFIEVSLHPQSGWPQEAPHRGALT